MKKLLLIPLIALSISCAPPPPSEKFTIDAYELIEVQYMANSMFGSNMATMYNKRSGTCFVIVSTSNGVSTMLLPKDACGK